MKKNLFVLLCSVALTAFSANIVLASVQPMTPSSNAGTSTPSADTEGKKFNPTADAKKNTQTEGKKINPTADAKKNTQTKSSSGGSGTSSGMAARSSLPLTTSLLATLNAKDAEIQQKKEAQDLILWADKDEKKAQTAKKKLVLNQKEMLADSDLKKVRSTSKTQGYRFVEKDKDAQQRILHKDAEFQQKRESDSDLKEVRATSKTQGYRFAEKDKDAQQRILHKDAEIQQKKEAQDLILWADKDEKKAQTAKKKLVLNQKEMLEDADLKKVRATSETPGYRFVERDREAQQHILNKDAEIYLMGLMKYHWLYLDYGPVRDYALKPVEFGYLSYHSALGDTMGEFSRGEKVYNGIYQGVQAGLAVLGSIPYVMNSVDNVVDAIQSHRKNSAQEDFKKAQDAMDEASDDYWNNMDAAAEAEKEATELKDEAQRLKENADLLYAQIEAADQVAAEARAKGDPEAEKAAIEESARLAQEQEELLRQVDKTTNAAKEKEKIAAGARNAAEEADERYNQAVKDEANAREDLANLSGVNKAKENRNNAEQELANATASQQEASARAQQAVAQQTTAKNTAVLARQNEQVAKDAVADLDAKSDAAIRAGNTQLAEDYKKQADAKRAEALNYETLAQASEAEAAAYGQEAQRQQAEADKYGEKVKVAQNDVTEAQKQQALADSEYKRLTGE